MHRPRTGGLHHVNLVVADLDRSTAFYENALGMAISGSSNGITFLRTPGTDDLLALQPSGGELDRLSGRVRTPGDGGGVDHIGFRVDDPGLLDALIAAVGDNGGAFLWRSSDESGHEWAFVTDPDGYVLQLG